MSKIIAVIWDFDKTLINGYMQDPMFKEYGIDSKEFWDANNALPEALQKEQGIRVNKDTIYLNTFIRYAQEGKFKGLNNAKLKEFGKQQDFYPGIPELFAKTKELVESNPHYKEYDIHVEHYIVSTGMAAVIRGSALSGLVDGIWGCEFIDRPNAEGEMVISEVAYTVDNTSKTKAIFEINKGVGRYEGVDVNSSLPKEMRRVQFEDMIYIADGPSDIPAFSVINQRGGATFAIYPHGKENALKQVEEMRMNGRINMYAEADYSEGTTAYMWIMNKIQQFADRIVESERAKISAQVGNAPKHLV